MSQDDLPMTGRVPYAVKQLHHTLRSAVDNALAGNDLSMAQFAVLSVLAGAGPLSPSELARRCSITRQSMQDVLKCLETRKLVDRHSSNENGRTVLVRMTEAGARLRQEVAPAVHDIEQRMTRRLSGTEQEQFLSWLNECIAALTHTTDQSQKP